MISMIAVGVLVVHAVWCLLCHRVSDGVLGKVLYALVSLGALAYLNEPGPLSQDLLNGALAAVAVRHFWMKTYWPSIKGRIMRRNSPSGNAAHELPPRRR